MISNLNQYVPELFELYNQIYYQFFGKLLPCTSEGTFKYFYEVVVYRIYKNRVETLGSKFYRTTLPYKNEDIQIVKDNDCIIMKQVIELWNC